MNLLHTGVRLGNFSGTLIPLEMGMSARGCVIAPCSRMLDSNEAKKKKTVRYVSLPLSKGGRARPFCSMWARNSSCKFPPLELPAAVLEKTYAPRFEAPWVATPLPIKRTRETPKSKSKKMPLNRNNHVKLNNSQVLPKEMRTSQRPNHRPKMCTPCI